MGPDPMINPHDLDAERALLGVVLTAPDVASRCGVSPAQLHPRHEQILTAVLAVLDRHGTADTVMVIDELHDRGALTSETGAYLAELVTTCSGTLPNLGHYAEKIRKRAARRTLHTLFARGVQTTETQPDTDVMLDNVADLVVHLDLMVNTPLDGDAPEFGYHDGNEFMDRPPADSSWVIPGLVERADRVMVLAGEGVGKSMLARQVAVLLAAGRHPFAPALRIRPRRVLIMDLENPPDLIRRSLSGMRDLLPGGRDELSDRLKVWTLPGGIDLRSAPDRARLQSKIERDRPELVIFGPLYKAATNRPGDNWEVLAAETAAGLDHLRDRYGCALWIEHHMPKGEGAQRHGPLGSSLWKRWPEFGLELCRNADQEPNVYQLDRFRGDREERPWPARLVKGAGHWPWTPDWDDAEERADVFAACDDDLRTEDS